MNHTAGEVARYLEARLTGDAHAIISGVASPERARATDLIYLTSSRHRNRVEASASLCVISAPGLAVTGKTVLEVADPKFCFAKAAALILKKPAVPVRVHPTAVIAPDAHLAADVTVAPYVVIEDGATIGAGTSLGAFCFIGRGAAVGHHCELHPRVTLYAGARLGDRVEVHSGAVIGSDGFGYVFGDDRHWKFPQIGGVEIEDDVEIGANTTVDRGSLETTHIGAGVKIDNLVQIAHNVQIGEHSILAAQTGVSGSSALGKGVIVGGQVGIADHCTLQDGVIAGAQAGIPTGKTIRRGQTVWGTPARPLDKFKEQYAWLARLPELAQRFRNLEQRASKSKEGSDE
jgi:UDP-3-O-[3-hydroxymyristoyl] glucosamine N-acyltransferase